MMLLVEISGAKNISLALLPTALTTETLIRFVNLPKIHDVIIQNKINEHLGLSTWIEGSSITYQNLGINNYSIPEELGSKIRSSLYYLGALLSCVGKALVPYPGGCNAGERSFDLHVGALQFMGAKVIVSSKMIYAERDVVSSKHIRLPMPSKGVTINLILLAIKLSGQTVIENASTMPEIRSLVSLLCQIGFDVRIDASNIVIWGNPNKQPRVMTEWTIPYDRVEAGTFAVLGLLIKEEMQIIGIEENSMNDLITFLNNIGAAYDISDNVLYLYKNQKLRPTQVNLGFPPAFDSDYGPIVAPLLCLIEGRSLIVDGHNTHRINKILEQLSQLGVNYKPLAENVFEIYGVRQLCGNCELAGSDIRGAMGLALAALISKGNVKVSGLQHIDRAYEGFLTKIASLGLSLNIS